MCYKMQSIFIIGAYTNQNVLNVHSDHSLKPAKMATASVCRLCHFMNRDI